MFYSAAIWRRYKLSEEQWVLLDHDEVYHAHSCTSLQRLCDNVAQISQNKRPLLLTKFRLERSRVNPVEIQNDLVICLVTEKVMLSFLGVIFILFGISFLHVLIDEVKFLTNKYFSNFDQLIQFSLTS
jgi:hypothetical protein